MTTDLTLQEVVDSLTGFDEIAIKNAFKSTVDDLITAEGGITVRYLRAMVFVCQRRQGDNDVTAYNAAEAMTQGELKTYFAEDSLESGKDATPQSGTPESSPSGAPTPSSPPSPSSD